MFPYFRYTFQPAVVDVKDALDIKTFLWKNGLTITDIARELELEYDASFHSIRNALTQMFYHGKYNAELAKLVMEKYGIKIDRPKRQSVREAIRQAA